MRNRPNGGLSGKARRAHRQARASRIHAQQSLHDYADFDLEDTGASAEQSIPIRHRREFLPSASHAEVADYGAQMELPLADTEAIAENAIRIASNAAVEGVAAVALDTESIASTSAGSLPSIDEYRASVESAESQQPLTWGGFLFGCAIGGAAAAVLLVILRTAVG